MGDVHKIKDDIYISQSRGSPSSMPGPARASYAGPRVESACRQLAPQEFPIAGPETVAPVATPKGNP